MILAWLACAEEAPAPTDDTCADVGTWELDHQGFFRTWCTGCHAATVPVELRQGAPLGVDFDTLEGVRSWRDPVAALAEMDAPTMPPAGGPDADQWDRLAAWLDCGLPGEDLVAVDPCDQAVDVAGGVTWSTVDDAAACGAGCRVEGDLTLGEAVGSVNLCAVTGDLTVENGGAAPLLGEVGGTLALSGGDLAWLAPELTSAGAVVVLGGGEVDLSGLATVAGSVEVGPAPDLHTVRLDRLATVGGDLAIVATGLTALEHLPSLVAIGGNLRVADNEALAVIASVGELEHAGGDVVLEGNDALETMSAFLRLTSVEGDLVISGSPSLTSIVGLGDVQTVGGDLLLSGLNSLTAMDALQDLTSVGGEFAIVGLVALSSAHTFEDLVSVGDLKVEGALEMPLLVGFDALTTAGSIRFLGLTKVQQISGFSELTYVQGDVELRDLRRLDGLEEAFPVLTDVGGALTMEALDEAVDLAVWSSLTSVGGTLTVRENETLADVTALWDLSHVGGDVIVEGNPALASADVDAWCSALTSVVVGEWLASENGT